MKKIILIIISILLFLYLGMFFNVNYNKKQFQIPVLMYHDVIMDEYYKDKPDTIEVSTFEKQLKYLKENNYKTLTLDELYAWKNNKLKLPKKSVVLTFDDGFYSFHYLVEPLVEKYDMHAICFVIGEYTNDTTPQYDPNKYGTIGIDQIRKHPDNVEYASHSYGLHKLINNKKAIEVASETDLRQGIDKMHEIYDFKYISYPFNTDTDLAIKVLKEKGYKLAFRGESEKVVKKDNNYKIPRIGIKNDIDDFKDILESNYHNNRYGTGLIRKIMITIERKIGKRLF